MKKLLLCLTALLLQSACTSSTHNIANEVIDLGIVVRDIDKSAAFYTQVLGMEEIKGFTGSAQLTGDSGLADYQEVPVRVFQLMDSKKAAKLKLMQFVQRPGKLTEQEFIHSSYGISYITIFVKDMKTALATLKAHGVRADKKSPVAIPGTPLFLTVVRDPDGNFIELVGPNL